MLKIINITTLSLVNENAASIIEEKNLTVKTLSNEIEKLLDGDKEIANTYSKNLKRIAITDSNEQIYKIVKKIIN